MRTSFQSHADDPPVVLGCSVKAGAKALGIGERLTRDLVASGKIESVKIEGRRVIVVAALAEFFNLLRTAQNGGASE
ncbi:hypothetical protein [Streptosporangium sp. NPDC004631]